MGTNYIERINVVLSLYKAAVNSYRWEHHYRDNKPLEQGFNRQMMADSKSSLYDEVCSLFIGLRLPQAYRYISMWEKQYIIQGEYCEPDEASYNRLQAIGQTFINECKRIAQEVCDPEGEGLTPRGAGYLPPDKGTAEESTDRDIKTLLQTLETLLQQYSSDNNDLNTDRAKKVFGKAIEKRLIVVYDNVLKWKKSNALLAFLCGIIYCDDTQYQDRVTKCWMVKRGSTLFPNVELCALFGVINLGQSRTQLNRLPKGYEEVLKLTEVAK